MPLKTQKQVMANLDRMNGKAVRRVRERYRDETLGPLVNVIRGAGNAAAALLRLDEATLRTMDASALEEVITESSVQCGLIGRASALPRG